MTPDRSKYHAIPDIRQAKIHYEESGSGPETIVFSHGLLMSGEMFRDQVEALSSRYRCITFDHRGQGRSEVSKTGYDMDSLTDDAVEVIRQLDCAPCHFAGLSMGGFVGMRLAIRHPGVVEVTDIDGNHRGPRTRREQGTLPAAGLCRALAEFPAGGQSGDENHVRENIPG